jgi:hypothetical protein
VPAMMWNPLTVTSTSAHASLCSELERPGHLEILGTAEYGSFKVKEPLLIEEAAELGFGIWAGSAQSRNRRATRRLPGLDDSHASADTSQRPR